MDKMYKKRLTPYLTYIFALLILFISGCSTNPTNIQTPSNQDVVLASNIIGQSMSNNTAGLVSSFTDATSMVGRTGFDILSSANSTLPTIASTADTMRGRVINYHVIYNPATGTHTVICERKIITPNFQKSVHLHLEYIYRDSAGVFLEFPRKSEVFSVDFKGSRYGRVHTPTKNSRFSRIDTLYYTGMNHSSSSITINGSHYEHGNFELVNKDSIPVTKVYDLKVKLLNVNILKSSITSHDLSTGVTGILSYKLTMHKTQDTTAVERHMSGTIDLNGNGTALLKFAHFTNRFLINLSNGKVTSN